MTSKKFFSFYKLTVVTYVITLACNNSGNKPGVSSSPDRQLVLDKLTGTWQKENGKSFERWTKTDDGSFQSVVFGIKGSDTSWEEKASIYQENNKWIFENMVSGQNNGKAVKFTSTLLNDTSVQFSNPAHDFPTD